MSSKKKTNNNIDRSLCHCTFLISILANTHRSFKRRSSVQFINSVFQYIRVWVIVFLYKPFTYPNCVGMFRSRKLVDTRNGRHWWLPIGIVGCRWKISDNKHFTNVNGTKLYVVNSDLAELFVTGQSDPDQSLGAAQKTCFPMAIIGWWRTDIDEIWAGPCENVSYVICVQQRRLCCSLLR